MLSLPTARLRSCCWSSSLCAHQVARAAVIPTNRTAGANIQGDVFSHPNVKDQFNSSQNDSGLVAPYEQSLPAPGLPGSASFENVTVSSSAQESLLLNSSGNAFSLAGNILATSSLVGHSLTVGGFTQAGVSAGLGFNVTTPSRYQFMVTAFSLTTDNADTLRGLLQVGFSGPSGGVYSRRFDFDDFEETGSLTGQIVAGHYSIGSNVSTSAGNIAHENLVGGKRAELSYTLVITPLSDIRWINPSGGSFGQAQNWDPQQVPGSPDTAVFDLPGTYTAQLDQDTTNKQLRANGAGVNVTFDLNGSEYFANEIIVGGLAGDNVSLTFTDSNPPVSAAATAPSGAAASHASPARIKADLLIAAQGGTATVDRPIMTPFGRVEHGGRVNVSTNKGHWEVGDLKVGEDGMGLLFVTGGGDLSGGRAQLGIGNGASSGLATVRGAGSTWDVQQLSLGVTAASTGRLSIEDHAMVERELHQSCRSGG